MKFRKLSLVLLAFPVLAFAADPLANNAYLLDKTKVVANTKMDCGPQADLMVKNSPQALKDSKGEKNVHYRALVVCAYSLGAVTGENLTKKAMGQASDASASEANPDGLDGVQQMRGAMKQCATDAIKSGIAVSGQTDAMLYCMFTRGAEAGRDFILASKSAK
jgi:hypothetical protein